MVELLPSLGGRIAIAWEGLPATGELLPSLGGWAIAGVRLLPSPGGRRAVAGRELLPSWEGRWAIAGVKLLPSLGGRRAVAGRELLPSWKGRWAIAWELLPSWEGRWAMAWVEITKPVWGGLRPSPSWGGGRGLAGGCYCLPWGKGGACLPVWIITCLGKIVITVRRPSYISFLFVNQVLELLICLSLTLLNLVLFVGPHCWGCCWYF